MWFVKPIQDVLLSTIKPLFEEQRKQIDERLDGMDKRSDQRFDKVDKEINSVRALVEQLDRKFTEAMIP